MARLLCEGEGKHPRDPLVKKIVAILAPRGNQRFLGEVMEMLRAEWGAPERESEPFPFNWTHYYDDIAPELDRYFISYPGLYPMSKLPEWKLRAVSLEASTGASRCVNLDPGTLDGARLLLASTKGQAHRMYMRDGIFVEVTLCRRKGKWESFFYTFPDFSSSVYYRWLDLVRSDWKRDYNEFSKEGSL